VHELARLVGYALRSGVAASVYFALRSTRAHAPVTIPKGAQANSVPAPGELMQTFETAEPLDARVEWNAIKPRLTRPQVVTKIEDVLGAGLYLKGTATKLKPNDPPDRQAFEKGGARAGLRPTSLPAAPTTAPTSRW